MCERALRRRERGTGRWPGPRADREASRSRRGGLAGIGFALAAALACGPGGDATGPPGQAPAREARLLSPSAGALLRVPWVPLAAEIPESFRDAPVQALLDGRDVTDPFGVTSHRLRSPHQARYLATLDLDGVEPGSHRLVLRFGSAGGGDGIELESRFVRERPRCRVELEVVDGEGAPLSARIAVFRGAEPYRLAGPDVEALEPRPRDARLHSVFVVGGQGRLDLDPGAYALLAVRGVRHQVAEREVALGEACAEPTRLRFELAEAVPTPGSLTADLHVHTGRSADAAVPDLPRYRSLVAADLDVVVISDHNRITDPGRALAGARAGGPGTRGIAGVEARIGPRNASDLEEGGSLGHANFYPLVEGEPLPPTDPLDLAEHIDNYRARQRRNPDPAIGPQVVAQLNHPRGLSFDPADRSRTTPFHALFNAYGFDRRVPIGEGSNAWMTSPRPGTGTTALDLDVLEVLNRFSWGPYLQVRADWFVLLNLGRFLTGVGNSDSHALAVELAGFPVNLVRAPGALDASGTLDTRIFVEALLAGRVSVSTGPVVDLRVAGARGPGGGPGDLVHAPGGRVRAEVEVRAATWVPVPEVRLVADGRVVRREPLPARPGGAVDSRRGSFTWELELERDAWVLAEAGWPIDDPAGPGEAALGLYARVAPGYVPLAFTNPVRIDADGDGLWTPLAPARAAELAEEMPRDVAGPAGGPPTAPGPAQSAE